MRYRKVRRVVFSHLKKLLSETFNFLLMNQPSTLFHRCRFFLSLLIVLFSGLAVQAQDSRWKDQATMNSIVQQELTDTNNALAMPNQTDWSDAMLNAYRSFLQFAQTEMASNHDTEAALNLAYKLTQTEVVPNPAARAMVMDDLHQKRVELEQKLTFN